MEGRLGGGTLPLSLCAFGTGVVACLHAVCMSSGEQFMGRVGNAVANSVWEANLDPASKARIIRANSPRESVTVWLHQRVFRAHDLTMCVCHFAPPTGHVIPSFATSTSGASGRVALQHAQRRLQHGQRLAQQHLHLHLRPRLPLRRI